MDFKKPDRKARLAQLGFLCRHTFTIVGRNRALLKPLIAMWAYAAVMVLMFFAGFILILCDIGGGTWLLLGGGVMFFYKFFFYSRAELTLSRMTYNTATGGSQTRHDARREVAGLKPQIRILGFLDMAAAWLASRKNKEGGLLSLVLGGIAEVWDLVNHFLLPAFAIDKLSLRDGIAKLKRIKDHVPETLVGVFGIDIMGGVIGTLMTPLYVIGTSAGIICGLVFGAGLPDAFSAGTLGELSSNIPNFGIINSDAAFNWLPMFMIFFLGVILHAFIARVIIAIKVVYFTLFYTRIMHAEALDPDIRTDLEGYLELGEAEMDSSTATA
ncbi:hypothetical protein SH611_21210 [Geminicoccaceae bacterium 1502E]|nr:hypothetical protein [Geminicoccaceae bacterium 1502E]